MPHFTPKRIACYALSAVFIAVALWVGLGIVSDFREWLWLRTAIEVVAEDLNYETKYVSAGDGTQRQTIISFAYSVEGKRYTRASRHLGPFANQNREADRIIEAAKRGEPVTCYVRRGFPEDVLLSRSVSAVRVWMAVVFAAGFAFLGTCVLVGCVSKRYAHQFE